MAQNPLTFEVFSLGPLATNAILVGIPPTPNFWLFDAPEGIEVVLDAIEARGGRLEAVWLTHAHADHIAGLDEVRRRWPQASVGGHAAEAAWYGDPEANLSSAYGPPLRVGAPDLWVGEGDVIEVAQRSVRVLHLPGHSPGSLGFFWPEDGELVSGDVLFRSGVGRWDFPGSDPQALRSSLARLTTLGDSVRVRPGHGGSTTIGRERAQNPYLRSDEAWA